VPLCHERRWIAAALLLGPMIGGIVLGVRGVQLDVHRRPYLGAQAIIAAMVSAGITPSSSCLQSSVSKPLACCGLHSVTIIAASTPRVDLPFVMALQSVRLVFVIGLAPSITRLVVRHSPHLRAICPCAPAPTPGNLKD